MALHLLQGLLEILSAASEFDDMPVRPGEEDVVRRLLTHAPVAVDKPRFTDPHVKTNSLLQVRVPLFLRVCAHDASIVTALHGHIVRHAVLP